MFELSHFYDYCKSHDILVVPYTGMPSAGATLRDGEDYAVFLDFAKVITARQLRGVCAHELGHVSTGALHKVSSSFDTVERSEHRANRWVAENILTEDDFRNAFLDGYTEPWQLAEYFDLPEQDILKAFSYWRDCCGIDFLSEEVDKR